MTNPPKTLPKPSHEASQSASPGPGGHWFVAAVWMRAEFQVMDELIGMGREVWLPHYSALIVERGWKQWRKFPHLPGYLFVKLEPLQSVARIEGIRGVREVLKYADGSLKPVPPRIMDRLHARLDCLVDRPYEPLEQVMMVSGLSRGAFAYLAAHIKALAGEDNFVLCGRNAGAPYSTAEGADRGAAQASVAMRTAAQ
jgi:hypothetical protein